MDCGSQLSKDDEDDEDDEDDKDDKDDKEDEEEEEERRTRQEEAEEEEQEEEEATDIKSNNPHLAGGEQQLVTAGNKKNKLIAYSSYWKTNLRRSKALEKGICTVCWDYLQHLKYLICAVLQHFGA